MIRTLLSDKPDIVIATPSRALTLIQSKVSLTLVNAPDYWSPGTGPFTFCTRLPCHRRSWSDPFLRSWRGRATNIPWELFAKSVSNFSNERNDDRGRRGFEGSCSPESRKFLSNFHSGDVLIIESGHFETRRRRGRGRQPHSILR